MEVGRRRKAEGADEEQLARGGLEQVGSANDFGDLHGGIIDDHGKLIGGDIVATPDDEVAEVLSHNVGLRPKVLIVEANGLAVGHTETPVHACRFAVVRGFSDPVAASAGIHRLVVAFVGSRGGERQVFAGAGAGVDGSGVAQFAPGVEVELAALALAVGAEGAADVGAFVPADAQPAKVFEHGVGEVGLGALGVEVLVAKSEYSFAFECALVGRPEGRRVADVEQPGGGGGEAAAVA